MAAGAVSSARDPQHDTRWKWLLLATWSLAAIWLLTQAGDFLGLAGRPWYGFWDSVLLRDRPYTMVAEGVVTGGAAYRAGIRIGDRFDLHEQTLDGRVVVMFQPLAIRPTKLVVSRGATTFTTQLIGSTVWEVSPAWKLIGYLPTLIFCIWFLGCALLIILRRWWSSEGHYLALILLLLVPGASTLSSNIIVTPDPRLTALLVVAMFACALAGLMLLVRLSSNLGIRYRWRRNLEVTTYAMIALLFFAHIFSYFNILTLRFDPIAFNYSSGGVGFYDFALVFAVVLVMIAAVAQTAPCERPRSAWLLLPLPIAVLIAGMLSYLSALVKDWYVENALQTLSASSVLLGAFLVTYAVLKRRVLDVEFIISRTLVVAAISLIVVTAFVLLEWVLGTVLTGVSHTTGLVANAALALVLGVSLSYIHKRVDYLVDAVLFRKRHEDERTLLDFSKEAAYITEPAALLDQAIAKIQSHTDARNAEILLYDQGMYMPVRCFGDGVASVGENDGAILALKTWHKPLDPHRYATSLQGALAVPMVARGQLLGVLLLGERAGGESYAPDEVLTLSHLAHGVASALDSLSLKEDGVQTQFQKSMLNQMHTVLNQLGVISDTLALALERDATNRSQPRP